MRFFEIVNRVLAGLGVMLVRRSSLARLSSGASSSVTLPAVDSLVALQELSGGGFTSIDRRISELQKELLRQQISLKWELVDYLERLVGADGDIDVCPLCGYEGLSQGFLVFESQCIFGGGRLVRHQCPECDVVYGAKKMFAMNAAELSRDYESHYNVFEEGDSTAQEIRAFHLLNPVKGGVYLNYGAGGWSKSVQLLRDQGWNVFAFEPHDSAANNLDYLIKDKASLCDLRFDGIFSNNVLEHLRQPIEELSFMGSILKPGARMSHATPCFEYLYEFTRFHLFFYLGRSRALLAEKANLTISDFFVDDEFMCALYEIKRP